jgi:hypothetical protein
LFATGPTMSRTRWRISSAALLVKVMARMRLGWVPREISQPHPRHHLHQQGS